MHVDDASKSGAFLSFSGDAEEADDDALELGDAFKKVEEEEAEEEAEEDDPYADAEPDAARVAQWVDEEELDNVSDESESEGDEETDGARLVRPHISPFATVQTH